MIGRLLLGRNICDIFLWSDQGYSMEICIFVDIILIVSLFNIVINYVG